MTLRDLGISTPSEISVGAPSHVCHCTKTTLVFLSVDGEASWLLLLNLGSLLLGGTVQLESTCACILKVTGQVQESQKTISNDTNPSFHQRPNP